MQDRGSKVCGMAQPVDQRLPLHARALDDLARRIRSSEWPYDQPLPAEAELARQYDVSLGTIRRVLADLAGSGLIERRQGRGTFVRRPSFERSLVRFFRAGDVVPESRILERAEVTADPEIEAVLGTSDAVQLLRLRLTAGEPLMLEHIHVPLPAFRAVLETPLEQFGDLLYPTYEQLTGHVVATASEELTVIRPDASHAALLGCADDEPLARIVRVARDITGRPLEHRVSFGIGSRFHYRMEIS